ncbi:MAG: OB-fold nucleic acid binding domain-containing protein, partial [Nitrospirota bacterium]|nr:OB-fold nucleic acid binding domain-containing protein [Nitrospirota bacterium]
MTAPVRRETDSPPVSTVARSDSPSIDLGLSIQYVKGVGPRRSELLQRLGISTLEDALYYLPRRYEDRSNLKKLSQIVYDHFETVSGTIKGAQLTVTPRRRMKIFEVVLGDGTGFITLKWFNQPYLQQTIKPGIKIVVSGVVRRNAFHGSSAEMDNPEYEIVEEGDEELIHAARIVPVYGVTAGLSVRQMRVMMKRMVEQYAPLAVDDIPELLLRRRKLLPLPEAFTGAHFPPDDAPIVALNAGRSEAHRRLVYDELFLFQLGLALRKHGLVQMEKGIVFTPTGELTGRLKSRLPFELTAAQERVIGEIVTDMARPRPMNRLVQGDVGCGKTMVALHAMLAAVESGWQAVLMAPTEILAEQ